MNLSISVFLNVILKLFPTGNVNNNEKKVEIEKKTDTKN